MKVNRAPKFIHVAGSNVKAGEKTIELLFVADNQQRFVIELDAVVIAPILTTISGLATQLRASLPPGTLLPTQAMTMKDFRIAMNPAGNLGWEMILQSGVSVILEFSKEQFAQLDAMMTEARELVNRSVQ